MVSIRANQPCSFLIIVTTIPLAEMESVKQVRNKPEIQIIRIEYVTGASSRKRVCYSGVVALAAQKEKVAKRVEAITKVSSRGLLASIQVAIAEKWPKKVKSYSTRFLYRIFCFQALRPFHISLSFRRGRKFFYQLLSLFAF